MCLRHLLKSEEKSIVCVCDVSGDSMALSQAKLLRKLGNLCIIM